MKNASNINVRTEGHNLAKVGVEGSNPFARSSPLRTKLSPTFSGRQKAQLPQAFARQAWGFESRTRYGKSLSECRFVSEAWGLPVFDSSKLFRL